jgi:hypothetical protein
MAVPAKSRVRACLGKGRPVPAEPTEGSAMKFMEVVSWITSVCIGLRKSQVKTELSPVLVGRATSQHLARQRLTKSPIFRPRAPGAHIVLAFGQADCSQPCAWRSATLFQALKKLGRVFRAPSVPEKQVIRRNQHHPKTVRSGEPPSKLGISQQRRHRFLREWLIYVRTTVLLTIKRHSASSGNRSEIHGSFAQNRRPMQRASFAERQQRAAGCTSKAAKRCTN